MRARRFILTAALLAVPVLAAAQDVRLHVPTDTVAIGERFEIGLAVERAPGVQVLLPDPTTAGNPAAGDAELVDLRRYPPAMRSRTRLDSATYTVAVFAVDSAQVGPVRIRLVTGADTAEVLSPSAVVPVRAEASADADALIGAVPAGGFPRALWPWLLGGAVLLLALVWGGRRLGARERSGDRGRDPGSDLLEVLHRLEESPPRSAEEVHPYYVTLSDAVRLYLGRTFSVPAFEMTTQELFVALEEQPEPAPEGARRRFQAVLEHADLVKFAGLLPPLESHARAVDLARRATGEVQAARAEPAADAASLQPR